MELRKSGGFKGVLDLRGMNVPLTPNYKKLNGRHGFKRGVSGRFERVSNPPSYKELLIQAIIYGKFSSLEKFADELGRSKAWAWLLINKPHKVKITPEFQEEMSKVLGIKILL